MVISQFHQNMIDKTKSLHDEAEKLPIINKIFSQNVSLDEYKTYLLIMAKTHESIENSTKEFLEDWNEFNIDINSYFRLELIKKDLELLNINFTQNNSKENIFESFEESVGFMYVMTGSMMGGGILAKKIQAKFQNTLDVVPCNYLLAFKEENPKKWMHFLQTLNAIENSSNDEQKEAITNGAMKAFKYVTNNLKNC